MDIYIGINDVSRDGFPTKICVHHGSGSSRKYCNIYNPMPLVKQEGHEALNRSPEYTGQRSNII